MFKSYLTITLLSLLLLAVGTFTLNWLIDPYGINRSLPKTDDYAKITKPTQIGLLKPNLVVIGNSRNYYSLDSSQLSPGHSYNLSMAGIGIKQVKDLFTHAIYAAPIKEAYIGLDALCSDPKPSDSLDRRFLKSSDADYTPLLARIGFNLSYQSTFASLAYLVNGNSNHLDPLGRQLQFDEMDYISAGFSHALAARDNASTKSTIKKASNAQDYLSYKKSCNVADLNEILRLAKSRNIPVIFFINPINMRYWEIQYRLGHLDELFFLKKLALETIMDFSAQNNMAPAPIYDFNLVTPITTEPLFSGMKTAPVYWYESSHHRKIVGDGMIAAFKNQKSPLPFPYFTILNQKNIQVITEDNKAAFAVWQKRHQDIVLEVDNIVDTQVKNMVTP